MRNESASSDPKIVCFDVKDRCCLTSDSGTPKFMPLEIHHGERYACPHVDDPLQTIEEIEQYLFNAHLHPPNPPIAILRHNYNHDQESLMWVALYIVLGRVDLAGAQKIFPRIFTNSLFPSWYREHFFKGAVALPPDAFHHALYPKFWDNSESFLVHLQSIRAQGRGLSQNLQHPHLCFWRVSSQSR